MKLLHLSALYTASILLISGCAEITPNVEKKVAIDNTLPKVVLTRNGLMSDMKTVAFEWKRIDDPRVKEIYVYKRVPKDAKSTKLSYYDTVENRFSTHYIDRDVEPGESYSYAFRVMSENAKGNLSKTYTIQTRARLSSVAWIHSIAGLPRMAKIIWRPHINERVASYIIEKRAIEDNEWSQIAELEGRLNAEYIDENLDDNHVYYYRIKAKTYDGIISTPSKTVKVVTKPLPKSVDKISATKDLPRAIEISWNAQKPEDFDHYNLYRSEDVDGAYEMIAKLTANSFRDKIDSDGKRYFYEVSIVDKDGLESEHEKLVVMGMSLPKPKAPTMVKADFTGSSIDLQWKNSDVRSSSFIVVKKAQKGWFDEQKKEFRNIKTNNFRDNDIAADTLYKYTVYSVDKNNIVSKPSVEVEIKTPESSKIIQAPRERVQSVDTEVVKPIETEIQEVIEPVEDLDLNEI
jgi:fibronectin type 3 domain-containing protein